MIETLISQPEGKTLEFKRDLSSPRPLLKTLVAFANSAGGRLVIGVGDDRRIHGVADPLDEEERLANLIADSISPRLVPNIELVTVEGKTLVIVEVFLSGTRPHYLKSEGIEKGAYVRLGSTNRQADAELVAELQRGVAGVSYDALPMSDLGKDVLDLGAVARDFEGRRAVDDTMLQSLRILVKDQGRLVPTRGGVLLYGSDRRSHFDDAWVQCGRFIGTDKADIFDHIDIEAPLPKSVDEIMLFLKKHAMRGADFSGIRRKDLWSIPLKILREVVINALVHADYSHRGSPIRVAFFDDRIEVESPGLLLPGLTIEDIKLGVSQLRNPVLARVFRELDLIEQWGSGIPGIFRQAAAEKLPEPIIEELAGRLRFTVPLKEIVPLSREQSRATLSQGQSGLESGVESGLESGVESGVESAMSLSILELLEDSPLAKSEIAGKLGKAKPTRYLNDLMAKLLRSGLIEYTVPEKPQSRLQKYRLTEKGRGMNYEE
jgi:ATP-dependent DNA helicase RecG